MNNFNLKSFLTENSLTPNSKLLKEQQLPDATKDLKASEAFKAVGIDMSKPVLVLTQDGGHGEQQTEGTVSAEEALKMFQRLRAEGIKNGKQDYYEFENEINFQAEGYEYKIAYFEEESTTTALMQKASGEETAIEEVEIPLEEEETVEGNLKERNDIVSTQDLDAAAAFKDAGIDMSQPVLVLTQDGGHGGQETKGTVSAENALNMFNNLRAQALELGKEDHYEFDNEIGFSAEGYEYKIAYFEEESTTTALMQKASGEVEEAWGFQSDFAKNIEKKGGVPTAKADPKVLQVSMGKNAEQEQRVIDIAKAAIGLMDEQPGTRAEEALKSVLGI
jgi:molybdenum-dependent DNA-binding transcriptional regulator ModE